MAEMTREVIVASCKANGGYASPLLNDQLYLHCKGFIRIQNLEPYSKARVLWLEQNAISDLGGMQAQQELVSLFLQNNAIASLRTFSAPLQNLRVINVSHNYIASLEGLGDACPMLETLQASHNRIASLQACEDIWKLSKTLTSVDLSFNRIATSEEPPSSSGCSQLQDGADDVRVGGFTDTYTSENNKMGTYPLVVVDFFKRLPLVSVIYFHGNGIAHGLKHYRRNMILHLPSLTYLDERPVFPEERRVVEAWGSGREEAEAAVRASIRDEKRQHLNSCVKVLTDRMDENRAVRDRLTRLWDERRAMELEQLTGRRRQHRDERAAVESHEASARALLEKEEQNAWWDLEENFGDITVLLEKTEAGGRRAHQHKEPVLQVVAEAKRETPQAVEWPEKEPNADVGSSSSPTELPTSHHNPHISNSIIAELVRSDDDILQEMEDEIQNVLYGINGDITSYSVAAPVGEIDSVARSPSLGLMATLNRHTLKAERAAHSALGKVADQLRLQRRGSGEAREDLWKRFERWEQRGV